MQQEDNEKYIDSLTSRTESETFFKAIIAQAPFITFVIDHKGLFTLSEGHNLSGLDAKPGDAVGKSVFERYRNFPHVLESVNRALEGEHVATEHHVQGRIFAASHSPVKDDKGTVT